MAVIWMDGFEIDFANDTAGLWTQITTGGSSGGVQYVSSFPRTGSGSLYMYAAGGNVGTIQKLRKQLPTTYTELYFGFSLRLTGSLAIGGGNNAVPFAGLISSDGSEQIQLAIHENTRVLHILRGGYAGTILGTGLTALSPDVTYYIDAHVVISDTVGVVQVRINGNLDVDLSGIDTNTSGGNIREFYFGFDSSLIPISNTFINAYYDDLVINDTTGTFANSWPGGAGVELLNPNADGTYSDWTSTGVNDYTEIDDWSSYGSLGDGDTTTVLSNTTNQKVSVQVENPTLSGEVLAIMLIAQLKNDNVGLDEMTQFVRTGGADFDAGNFVPATAYAFRHDIINENPDTVAQWLIAEINNVEYGVKRIT